MVAHEFKQWSDGIESRAFLHVVFLSVPANELGLLQFRKVDMEHVRLELGLFCRIKFEILGDLNQTVILGVVV